MLYNFAIHPILGVPSGANTSDITGFASQLIEEQLAAKSAKPAEGSPSPVAFFWQGCAGDINPIGYKDLDAPRDAEPLGNLLGLSVLRAARAATPMRVGGEGGTLELLQEEVQLPRAKMAGRIARLEAQQQTLLDGLEGTFLDLKTFLPLAVKHCWCGPR